MPEAPTHRLTTPSSIAVNTLTVALAPSVSLAHDEHIVHVPARGSFKLDPATFEFLEDLQSSSTKSAPLAVETLTERPELRLSLQRLADSGIVHVDGGAFSNQAASDERLEFVGSMSDLVLRRDSHLLTRTIDLTARAVAPVWTRRVVVALAAMLPVLLLLSVARLNLELAYSAWVESPFLVIALTIAATLVRSMLHESGHMAAAHRYGISTPSCGIGFYLHLPVLYVDLTEVDTHERLSRVHVDLAGIAMDSLILFVALAVSLSLGSSSSLALAVTISLAFSSLGPVNPVTKSDLNWCFRDLFRARGMTASWGRPTELWSVAASSSLANERRFARVLIGLSGVALLILGIAAARSVAAVREILSAAMHNPTSLIPLVLAWTFTVGVLIATATAVRRRSQPATSGQLAS